MVDSVIDFSDSGVLIPDDFDPDRCMSCLDLMAPARADANAESDADSDAESDSDAAPPLPPAPTPAPAGAAITCCYRQICDLCLPGLGVKCLCELRSRKTTWVSVDPGIDAAYAAFVMEVEKSKAWWTAVTVGAYGWLVPVDQRQCYNADVKTILLTGRYWTHVTAFADRKRYVASLPTYTFETPGYIVTSDTGKKYVQSYNVLTLMRRMYAMDAIRTVHEDQTVDVVNPNVTPESEIAPLVELLLNPSTTLKHLVAAGLLTTGLRSHDIPYPNDLTPVINSILSKYAKNPRATFAEFVAAGLKGQVSNNIIENLVTHGGVTAEDVIAHPELAWNLYRLLQYRVITAHQLVTHWATLKGVLRQERRDINNQRLEPLELTVADVYNCTVRRYPDSVDLDNRYFTLEHVSNIDALRALGPDGLAINPTLTVDLIRGREWAFNLKVRTANPAISVADKLANRTLGWHWPTLATLPGVPFAKLTKFPGFSPGRPFDWPKLSGTAAFTMHDLGLATERNYPIDWVQLSQNPSITLAVMQATPQYPWDWTAYVFHHPTPDPNYVLQYPLDREHYLRIASNKAAMPVDFVTSFSPDTLHHFRACTFGVV